MKYNFNKIVDRKGTYSTQWDFIGDRFPRSDILPFSISDTDFKAPTPIIEKLKEVAEFGVYGYTRWNHDDYRKTIAQYFQEQYDTTICDDWVIYSPSVMYSVSLLIRFLKTPEKPRVLTFTPMYDSFYTVISENGCELVESKLEKVNGTYTIDFEDFEKNAKKCSVFLLCSPHNPTGKSFTEAELKKLVDICEKHDVKIISDEIHMDLTLHGNKRVPLYKVETDNQNIYTASSASKVFNIPGLGGSFVILANETTRQRFLQQTKMQDFVNSSNIMGMWATIVGYRECVDYVEGIVSHTEKNFEYLENFIRENCPLITFDVPEATYLAWIDISGLSCTTDAFLDLLVNVGKVGFMGGGTYGDKDYIRINCGCPREKLEAGMAGLKKAYDSVMEK